MIFYTFEIGLSVKCYEGILFFLFFYYSFYDDTKG